jgi:hypothetical protein
LEGINKQKVSNQPEKRITKAKESKNFQPQINTATTDVTGAYYNTKVTAKSTNKHVSNGL